MSSRVADIRTGFLDYFASKEHKVLPSASLVPVNDPTLLFTNAGMVPFKNQFIGQEQPVAPRAVSSQKCVRAGGKHNDLDNVGYTARHHTFFEMLGNFSFGDYFKEGAIELAWEFLTKELAIPQEKLLVTVYSEDDEAPQLWKKIAGLDDSRIIKIPTSDNFWSMGDTGPCGPCSEIFFDHGEAIAGGPPGSPDEDGDRFIEIWNLVFMQFDQLADGSRKALPKPCIDTGMGLERIAALLQGKHDNYDTDLMQAIISVSSDLSGQSVNGDHRISHRVIADHLRSAAFLMADGVTPSNEGRGYVLRRIMRRAMRHAHLLGTKEPLMWRLFPTLQAEMGAAYPELNRAEALITQSLKQEEERFRETLARGLHLLEDELGNISGTQLSGEVAFKLYDTYGFPIDLTQDALREKGLSVDIAGFDAAMERQKVEARANWSGSGAQATEEVWFDVRGECGATEFVGYQYTAAEGNIVAMIDEAGERIDSVSEGGSVAIILNQTPFYAESGGQAGDRGHLSVSGQAEVTISDTLKKLGDLHVLQATVTSGMIKLGDLAHQEIDVQRRDAIRSNHSATHLLHEALRRVLGPHVTQKGSLVQDNYLRFDFSQQKPLTSAEIAEVEVLVNQQIRKNGEVSTRLMSPDDAISAGALALFGEKYGEEVRVLSMGLAQPDDGLPSSADNPYYSVELCGGTHVSRLGDIGAFTITQETSVASGIRRIEARTGAGAMEHFAQLGEIIQSAADQLKVGNADIVDRIGKLIDERKKLERELADAKKQIAMGQIGQSGASKQDGGANEAETINGITFLGKAVNGLPAKQLRSLVDEGKSQIGSGVVVFIGIDNGKAGIAVGVTQDLTDKLDAVALVRIGAEVLGGQGGGGRPDMAQAGGPNTDDAPAALDAIRAAL